MDLDSIKNNIFKEHTEASFSELALEIFRLQAVENPVYAEYLGHLGLSAEAITHYRDIPPLPVQLFKGREVILRDQKPEIEFSSSGTTGMVPSQHLVSDLSIYEQSFVQGFEREYGSLSDWTVYALLPGYMEREGSSLIYMAQKMIERSTDPTSGFFLSATEELRQLLQNRGDKKVLLLGVSFALLDFAESGAIDLSGAVIMETGGMKGRRQEWTRAQLHAFYAKAFGVDVIHSEYGMTELLSQGYSKGHGLFVCPPWMRVLPRDTSDPLSPGNYGKTAGLNIIDLANVNSCSFISVQDLGRVYEDGSFEVLGRFDDAEARGCNLLIANS